MEKNEGRGWCGEPPSPYPAAPPAPRDRVCPEWKVEREGTFLGKTSWFGNSRLAALAAEPVPVLAPVTVNCVFKLGASCGGDSLGACAGGS